MIERMIKMSSDVPKIILQQLGGNKFIAMTGSYDFVGLKDGLRMTLRRNMSKANRLEIKLNGLDYYDMVFYKHLNGGVSLKTGKVREAKDTVIERFEDVDFESLQSIFTQVTGFDTHL